MSCAIISVSDKTGLVELAKTLQAKNIRILASGGTQKFLETNNIKCESTNTLTGFTDMVGGRVKTLNHKIFAGILADRSIPEHVSQLKELDIPLIDFVICNLYPFEEKPGIETIDIGGVTLMRASAKNYKSVTCITNPSQYPKAIEELNKSGSISESTRLEFAKEAFKVTSRLDSKVAEFMGDDSLRTNCEKVMQLRYGENPHQSAALYRTVGQNSLDLTSARQLQGKELSFNNIQDINAVLLAIKSFTTPCICIVKHANPCGIATDKNITEAYKKAHSTDPTSSYGGIVGVNSEVTEELAKELTATFLEAVIAPSYTDKAKEILTSKKNLRVLELPLDKPLSKTAYLCVEGGFLVQDSDVIPDTEEKWEVVTKAKPTPDEMEAAKFAFKAVRFMKSNSICVARKDMTIGLGAGQPNRVGSVKIAIENAKHFGFDMKNATMASDGFFPFNDSITVAAEAGIKCIVQPGGSIRDQESIDECNKLGISMIVTHCRHFRH
ncbi:MAG: bifunctional phosphoribosylaminoimidazolecarboxamide formyltransferase/IMP cyclohydrolase [bacterium]|nr:bifunctional phosphoribosylaminoimidazolecarboxamide formyltransferase/IMP cyclohydrolase [bacterium]